MDQEKKICQNCKQEFVIESEDFEFYEKMKVPAPTWCPECRLIRRLVHRAERSFFKDKCQKCNRDIVSLYAPGHSFPVYCSNCWWKDSWDGTDYGQDYDFSKPFFQQLRELQNVVPTQATNLRNSTNCEYCHGTIRCKDCTHVFGGLQAINSFYCQAPMFSRNCVDSDILLNADHVYETVSSNDVYNTKFAYFSNECIDCSFIFNCIGCSNCFGCINLRNKKYCIYNVQYSKEEYEKNIKEWDLGSYKTIQEVAKNFWELYYKTPRRFASIINSSNVTGDDIKNTRNCKNCFITKDGIENCKNLFCGGLLLKDSHDVIFSGDTSQLLYEVGGSTQSQRVLFSRGSNNLLDCEYCENVYGGAHLFGCVKLKQKKYCILNKQYTKEEYEELIPKIKKHMMDMPYIDKMGRVYKYGEFYPPEHSMWAYNETWANKFFPLTKEEALGKGYFWRDLIEKDYKITIGKGGLLDYIDDVPDSIINEVIACEHEGKCNEQCTTAFKILPDELEFYRKMRIPLPRLCPNCRHYQRVAKLSPLKLWHRKCMKLGCTDEFETAISDQRREIIYCEKCYQQEFI